MVESPLGYRGCSLWRSEQPDAVAVADQYAPGRRAFAVEGTGSFGAGLTRVLAAHGEQVFEVGRLRLEEDSRRFM